MPHLLRHIRGRRSKPFLLWVRVRGGRGLLDRDLHAIQQLVPPKQKMKRRAEVSSREVGDEMKQIYKPLSLLRILSIGSGIQQSHSAVKTHTEGKTEIISK